MARNDEVGAFGQCIRFLLVIINVIFIILGLVIFVTACVLKWGSTALNDLIDIPEINTIIDTSSSISGVAIFMLILGAFIILLALFGFLGVYYMNRFFLWIYLAVVVVIFVGQIIALLVLVFSSSTLKDKYKEALNKTITDINTKGSDYDKKCKAMKGLSDLFQCCGANGPKDFTSASSVENCCFNKNNVTYTVGCADKTINDVEKNVVNLLVIPSAVILGIEFFAIIMVPFLAGKAGTKNRSKYDTY